MKINTLLTAILMIPCITSCGYEPEMPDNAVNNSKPGKFNPKNCIVYDETVRRQLFSDIKIYGGPTYEFEFDSKKRLTKMTRISDNPDNTMISWEYPDEKTVVMNINYSNYNQKDVFYIGENGFANKCISYVNGYDFVYTFGYDADGYLVTVYDDGNDQVFMEYKNGNLVKAKFINNCGETTDRCEYTYTEFSNVNFRYMPYLGLSGADMLGVNNVPFTFEYVYSDMMYAYIAGLIGKPSKKLPDKAVHTDDDGIQTTYYFHNQYLTDPADISIFRCILHLYGWSDSDEARGDGPRIENVSNYYVEFSSPQ